MAISLNDHENRIKSFEGKLPGIENRINDLASSAKSWEIVTLSGNGTYAFNSKYSSWNFIVINGTFGNSYDKSWQRFSAYCEHNENSYLLGGSGDGNGNARWSFSYSKSGNNIVLNGSTRSKPSSIKVLFYK